MKNPSKKQDAEGNWYGRAASNVRSFRHFAWFDWAAIGFARDHLWAGLALPDEIKYNQYIPCPTRRIPNMLSPHFDPQGHYGEAIVGLSVGADAILVMQRCAKGHSRCDCKAAEKEKICIPLPRRSMYIFRGRARYSLQPGLHARPRVAGEPRRAAGLESDRRAPVDYLSRRQGLEPLLPRGAPLPGALPRGPRRAQMPRRRAPAAEGQEDEAQGREGAVGPAERGVPGLARPPLREAGLALLVVVLKNVTQMPPPAGRSAENTTRDARARAARPAAAARAPSRPPRPRAPQVTPYQ